MKAQEPEPKANGKLSKAGGEYVSAQRRGVIDFHAWRCLLAQVPPGIYVYAESQEPKPQTNGDVNPVVF